MRWCSEQGWKGSLLGKRNLFSFVTRGQEEILGTDAGKLVSE